MTTSAFGNLRQSGSPVVAPAAPADVPVVVTAAPAPRTSPVLATALSILGAVLLGFAAYVGALGSVVHARAQQLAYADLRQQLANGTAPLGQLGADNIALALGSPVALLEGPGFREVVREGTTSGVLTGGPGHRRDTPLPGQPGTSVIYGRAAAFGGPFASIGTLRRGAAIIVTTGQGRQRFAVTDVRRAGDPTPPVAAARLSLVTATGPAFLPSGLLIVDADLVSPAVSAFSLRPVDLRAAERPLAGDSGALIGLVLWGQALLLAACLVVWMSARWGRRQSWLVGAPLLGALGVAVAASAAQLLPNLT
ncbi:MAG: sortase [Mycobacteriales bacterium]